MEQQLDDEYLLKLAKKFDQSTLLDQLVYDERTILALLQEVMRAASPLHGWKPLSQAPTETGRFLIAIRGTEAKEPRIDLAWFAPDIGWTNRFMTHWMELPEFPS